MTLYRKALIIVSVMLVGLIGGVYATSRVILLNTFAELEEQSVYQNVNQVLGILDEEISHLNTIAGNWILPDDTYTFTQDISEGYVRINLRDSVFANLRLNFVLFTDASGQPVFGKAFDLQNQQEVPIPQDLYEYISAHGSVLQSSLRGIILLPEGPILVALHPIATGESGESIQGKLIVGRYLDSAETGRLARANHLSLTIRRFDDADLPPDFEAARSSLSEEEPISVRPLSAQSIAAYALLQDIYGTLLLLRVDSPRIIYKQGQASMRYFIGLILTVSVIFSAAILLFLERLTQSQQKLQESERRYQQRARELAALNNAARAVASSLNLDEVLNQALAEVRSLLDAEGASVLLYKSADEELFFAAVTGPGSERLVGVRMPAAAGLAGWVLREKQAVRVSDVRNDPRFDDRIDALTGLTTRSLVAVPLMFKQEASGVVEVINKVSATFSEPDLEMLETLASSIAIAIQNAQLFEQVQAGRQRLRQLAQQIVLAQEKERRRLSRELHDETGQALTALKISLELTQADLAVEEEALRQRLAEAVVLTDTTMEEIRLLAHNLRPPALDTVGLNPTLEDFCRDFARHTKLPIDYTGTEFPELPDAVTISLYRFLQETLTNIAKHANAEHVWVVLQYDADIISLSVEDDGQGFDKQARLSAMHRSGNHLLAESRRQPGIGLLGMQERLELLGGWLEIESQPGRGTRVIIYVPWKESQ